MKQHHAYSYRNVDGNLNYILLIKQGYEDNIHTGHRLVEVIVHGRTEDCPPKLWVEEPQNVIQINSDQLIEPIAVCKKSYYMATRKSLIFRRGMRNIFVSKVMTINLIIFHLATLTCHQRKWQVI